MAICSPVPRCILWICWPYPCHSLQFCPGQTLIVLWTAVTSCKNQGPVGGLMVPFIVLHCHKRWRDILESWTKQRVQRPIQGHIKFWVSYVCPQLIELLWAIAFPKPKGSAINILGKTFEVDNYWLRSPGFHWNPMKCITMVDFGTGHSTCWCPGFITQLSFGNRSTALSKSWAHQGNTSLICKATSLPSFFLPFQRQNNREENTHHFLHSLYHCFIHNISAKVTAAVKTTGKTLCAPIQQQVYGNPGTTLPEKHAKGRWINCYLARPPSALVKGELDYLLLKPG